MNNKNNQEKNNLNLNKKPKRKLKPGVKKFFKYFFLLLLIGFFVGSGALMLWASQLEIPSIKSLENLKMSQATKIYDKKGETILYNIYDDEKRTIIPLSKISKYIQWATISIEDQDFYKHNGAQPWRLLGSIYHHFIDGARLRGASTLTQQVIKQTVLTPKRDIQRKMKEIILAYKLEKMKKKQFNGDKKKAKDSILEMYLNESPYGGVLYGVEEASNFYFGKHASDVTLAEAAYLASMPQAPTTYSPYGKHRKALDARKNAVLRKMLQLGYITNKEYQEAKNEKVNFVFREKKSSIKAPHFVMYVKKELSKLFDEEKIKSGGLKVYTTLDYELQEKVQDIVKKNVELAEKEKLNVHNGAVVIINPQNGEILTMVGSKDYWAKDIDGKFNVATAKRQPGSTFKPFAYMTAFQKGYTPKTVLWDVKTEFSDYCQPNYVDKNGKSDKCYHPNDFDHKFKGPILMEQALPESRNVPAVKTLYLAGLSDTFKNIKAMGIKSLNLKAKHYGLSLVLGSGEVEPLNLASAYGVWANQGIRVEPTSIWKVEDSNGNVLYEHRIEKERILSKEVSLILSRILSNNKLKYPTFGLHSPLYFTKGEVASKTGTTSDNRDFWVAGFNPGDVAVVAWMGNNDNSKAKGHSGYYTKKIWRESMEEAIKKVGYKNFERVEEDYSDLKPVLRGIWNGSQTVKIDLQTGDLATPDTPEEFIKEIIIPEYHSILHWVNPKNPRGPIPQKKDKAYERWEYGVKNWTDQHQSWVANDLNITLTELMNATNPEKTKEDETNQDIEIVLPQNHQIFDRRSNLHLVVATKPNVEIEKIMIFINGVEILDTKEKEINIDLSSINYLEETNALKVIMIDKNGKMSSDAIEFMLRE